LPKVASLLEAVPQMPKHLERPLVFDLLFWSCLVLGCTYWALTMGTDEQRASLLVMAVAVVILVVAWAMLPWSPGASVKRKLSAPLFMVSVFVFGQLTSMPWTVMMYLLACANAVFLFGFVIGVAYVVASLPLMMAGHVAAFRLTYPELPFDYALGLGLPLIPAAVFVIGICTPLIEAVRHREEAKELLAELETANKELTNHAAEVRELTLSEERARMGREMHDTVGHYMTVINLQLENARRSRIDDPEGAWEEIDAAKEATLKVLSEVRRAVRALKPLALEERSGVGALAALARGLSDTDVDASFGVEGEERELPRRVELVLYRAMQEGLTNVFRHARARRVGTVLTFLEGVVALEITDDGVGAPEGELEEGFGLLALEERAKELDGALRAGNRPEGGFSLRIELPIGR
jgi:signal transduction histidine kinase